MGLAEYLTGMKEPSVEDVTWQYVPTSYLGVRGLAKGLGYLPYAKDIYNGLDLLFHKPFDKMTNEEFKQYGNLGKTYYQEYLQNNPVNIKGYGTVSFSRKNKGKDFIKNMEQYPLLRKNLENATKENFTTNYKNETDRNYDYFLNKYKGSLYHYLIEDIKDVGKRYKMMKNKTEGE